eukprot:597772-Rhodomonas_salina.1
MHRVEQLPSVASARDQRGFGDEIHVVGRGARQLALEGQRPVVDVNLKDRHVVRVLVSNHAPLSGGREVVVARALAIGGLNARQRQLAPLALIDLEHRQRVVPSVAHEQQPARGVDADLAAVRGGLPHAVLDRLLVLPVHRQSRQRLHVLQQRSWR